MEKGKLIVIEGLDGSGKATQTAALLRWMQARGEKAVQITFPDYESDSSALVRMYLAGEVGGVTEVNPYAASSFYAADRYISYQKKWKKQYLSGYTILSDRYTTSNAAHQMSKLPPGEWDGYLAWLEDYEYTRLCLPRPDRVVYLDMHPDTSRRLLQERSARLGEPMDIHEQNLSYLLGCRRAALFAAEKLRWNVVSCCDGGEPRPVEAVNRDIRRILGDSV